MSNMQLEKAKKVLEFIFGEIYLIKLKNFFEQFYNNYFDFVVFTTRRCHILFCIFNRLYFSGIRHNNTTFISDKALHFYNKELCDCKCAIVDDILIHGRALKSVKERVSNKNPKLVKTYVFMQSIEANDIADFCVEDKVKKDTWKKFSNKIVSAIIMLSFPYTSYIYSSYRKMDKETYDNLIINCKSKFKNFTKSELSLNEVDHKNEINRLLSENIECYIFDIPEFSKKHNLDFSCFRVYYNKYLNYCVVTPYSITNSLSEKEIDNVLRNYFSNDSEICKVNKYETKYRAITALYSYCILYYIRDYYELDFLSSKSEWIQNEDDINMSYYNSFFSELESIISKNEIRSLNYFDCKDFDYNNYIAHKSNCDDELQNDVYTLNFLSCINNYLEINSFYNNEMQKQIFNSNYFFDTLESKDELSKWFYNYLASVSISEEKCFSEESVFVKNTNPDKQLGLSFSGFSVLFNNENFKGRITKFDFYSKLILSADSGFLSIFADYYLYKKNNKINKCYSNFIITGEHVCRLFQNKYILFVFNVIEMYNNFKKDFSLTTDEKKLFDSLFYILKANNIQKSVITNLESAYAYIKDSSNQEYIKDSIYEEINDEFLENLLDVCSELIEVSANVYN